MRLPFALVLSLLLPVGLLAQGHGPGVDSSCDPSVSPSPFASPVALPDPVTLPDPSPVALPVALPAPSPDPSPFPSPAGSSDVSHVLVDPRDDLALFQAVIATIINDERTLAAIRELRDRQFEVLLVEPYRNARGTRFGSRISLGKGSRRCIVDVTVARTRVEHVVDAAKTGLLGKSVR